MRRREERRGEERGEVRGARRVADRGFEVMRVVACDGQLAKPRRAVHKRRDRLARLSVGRDRRDHVSSQQSHDVSSQQSHDVSSQQSAVT